LSLVKKKLLKIKQEKIKAKETEPMKVGIDLGTHLFVRKE